MALIHLKWLLTWTISILIWYLKNDFYYSRILLVCPAKFDVIYNIIIAKMYPRKSFCVYMYSIVVVLFFYKSAPRPDVSVFYGCHCEHSLIC